MFVTERLYAYYCLMQVSNPRILIAPLDWGLGHATRCIPVIKSLIKHGAEPVLAGPESVRILIRKHIPGLEEIPMPGYEISYSRLMPAWMKIFIQVPGILKSVQRERVFTRNIIQEKQIDGIISDNRYGVYDKDIPSIIITHQLNLILPTGLKWLRSLVKNRIHKWSSNFQEIWIPDFFSEILQEPLLSGNLSWPIPEKQSARFIGIASRFGKSGHDKSIEKIFDFVIILSGPEPQRSLFLKKAILFARRNQLKGACITPEKNQATEEAENNCLIKVFINPADELFLKIINQTDNIICRSGYSSIMDLFCLKRNALLVPTPGQTEQLYLAVRMQKIFTHSCTDQKNLVFLSTEKFPSTYQEAFSEIFPDELLDYAVSDFLSQMQTRRNESATNDINHKNL